ncbi:c-type cytochrome [Algoriphagus halophilus]|uniref:Cytochrome c n=1 Tax=Algoriphagus halophilus TaxID=226505 RepID=A0A1N6EG06_9BACT|nr:cytochrome c [Algoriphagus halophilus]SIN81944.1 Cytochrome c [Algoriphagus halophilus]
MKSTFKNLFLATIGSLVFACGGEKESQSSQGGVQTQQAAKAAVDPYENWKDYQGVGPVKEFTLPNEIDETLATTGQTIFESKCTACHKTDKKFIGPSPKDILNRRNPAWIMNMILVPDKMVVEDPIAKKLIMDFNGSPMANQSLTEDEARAVLEYFRTL